MFFTGYTHILSSESAKRMAATFVFYDNTYLYWHPILFIVCFLPIFIVCFPAYLQTVAAVYYISESCIWTYLLIVVLRSLHVILDELAIYLNNSENRLSHVQTFKKVYHVNRRIYWSRVAMYITCPAVITLYIMAGAWPYMTRKSAYILPITFIMAKLLIFSMIYLFAPSDLPFLPCLTVCNSPVRRLVSVLPE